MTVYICGHPEAVAHRAKLRHNRNKAVLSAARCAARVLRQYGFNPVISQSFGDWYGEFRFHGKARMFNFMCVDHKHYRKRDLKTYYKAARAYIKELRRWEHLTAA